jgi:SAM-dependent methyltransferase
VSQSPHAEEGAKPPSRSTGGHDNEVHPSAARIVGLYEDNAPAWDAARQRSTFFEKPLIDRFIAALPPGGSVLDIGCGAGAPVACHLLEQGLRVTGSDSSAALIGLCRERYPAGEWIVADMRVLNLGRTFNGLVAWWSLFHLPPDSQRAMFPVFARHAAPGGLLLFNGGDRQGEAIGEWCGEPLYHSSLAAAEYDALLDAHGFDLLHHAPNDPDCGDTSWRLARRRG